MRFRPLVLCYHAVSDGWTDRLAVAPDVIEHQVRRLLRRGYRPVTAEQALRNQPRTLHVTFDDAYRSVASVQPTLEALGVPISIFACTDNAEAGRALDVPELRGRATGRPSETLTMDWDALAELSRRGVEIGSHTASHPHLPQLSDAQLRHELMDSRERLEERLTRPCRTLAYPYGEEDRRVRAAARDAGYALAFGLRGERSTLDPHALPRVEIYRHDGRARYALKTSPAGRPITRAVDVLRRSRS